MRTPGKNVRESDPRGGMAEGGWENQRRDSKKLVGGLVASIDIRT